VELLFGLFLVWFGASLWALVHFPPNWLFAYISLFCLAACLWTWRSIRKARAGHPRMGKKEENS
jgi:hypothetical protein